MTNLYTTENESTTAGRIRKKRYNTTQIAEQFCQRKITKQRKATSFQITYPAKLAQTTTFVDSERVDATPPIARNNVK